MHSLKSNGINYAVLISAGLIRAAQFSELAIAAPYLAERHISPIGISLTFATSILAAAASQPIWARLISGRGTMRIAQLTASIAFLGFIGFAVFLQAILLCMTSFLITLGCSGYATAIRSNIALLGEHNTAEKRFGILTSAQTIGGAIGPAISGLIMHTSARPGIWFCALVTLLSVIFLSWGENIITHSEKTPQTEEAEIRRSRQIHLIGILFPVILVLVGESTLFGSASISWGLYLHSLGAHPTLISWSFTVFSLPMIFLGSRIDKILGSIPRCVVYPLCAVFLGAISISYAFTTHPLLAVGVSFCEGICMVLTIPVLYGVATTELTEATIPAGMSILSMVGSVATLIGSTGGGILLEHCSIRFTLIFFGVVCICMSLLNLLYVTVTMLRKKIFTR